MKLRHTGLRAIGAIVLLGCGSVSPPALETLEQKASYGIGYEMGRQLVPAGERLDIDAFRQGIDDAMGGAEPVLPRDELTAAVNSFSESVIEAANVLAAGYALRNAEEAEVFLKENGAREGVTTLANGVQIEVLRPGEGPTPGDSSRIIAHYRGTLINGTQFSSSGDSEPAELAMPQLIPGLRAAAKLMAAGGRYRVVVPGELAYGMQGMGNVVSPNATLIFELDVVTVAR